MKRYCLLISFLLLATTGVVGCDGAANAAPYIDLNKGEPIAPIGDTDEGVLPLRVAVAAFTSPKEIIENYRPLVDYIGERLNRPVQLIQRHTYAEVNELIQHNEVDLAFVCPLAYVRGQREFEMELLAIPHISGNTVHYSKVIVRSDLPANRFEELRGAVFAFTDPLSDTGYLYPNVLLKRLGESADTFFQHTFFTYSHDNAIYAVTEDVADAAAVDSLVLDYILTRDPALQDHLRVINTSPAFGMPPVVVGSDVRPQIKARLQESLLGMVNDLEGWYALRTSYMDRFVPARDQDYDLIRSLEQELGGP